MRRKDKPVPKQDWRDMYRADMAEGSYADKVGHGFIGPLCEALLVFAILAVRISIVPVLFVTAVWVALLILGVA